MHPIVYSQAQIIRERLFSFTIFPKMLEASLRATAMALLEMSRRNLWNIVPQLEINCNKLQGY